MAALFLVIIYLAFISLGLPDSLLGVTWPVMHLDIKAPLEAAGFVSMTITVGTIVSSLASGYVIKKLGTGKVTLISCIMTAGALLGFSISNSLIWLIFLAIPFGLGAGSVDSALNNYVALHYKARHMSWLHCFWGIGATIGPVIMSWFIAGNKSWRGGYITISVIQFTLALLLFITLPLWKRAEKGVNNAAEVLETGKSIETDLPIDTVGNVKPLQIKGVKPALLTFLFYCGIESTIGLWGSSFLVNIKGLSAATAAQWVSLYYAGITVGRFITGFVTIKVSNNFLIRTGQITALTGAILILIPFSAIFPCMIHETPARFGKEHSQKIIGYQMAVAYTGVTLLPPLLGFIQSHSTLIILPYFVLAYIIIMLICSEKINLIMKAKGNYF